MIYAIPLEAPSDLPEDEGGHFGYTWLPLFGGKRLRVYWAESEDRTWAYDQKRWIDAEAKRTERQAKREVSVDEVLMSNEAEAPQQAGVKQSYALPYRFPQTEQMALTRIELEMLQKYIEERQPRSWRAFYLKEACGADVKEITEELGVIPARVYQLIKAAQKLALQFREEW